MPLIPYRPRLCADVDNSVRRRAPHPTIIKEKNTWYVMRTGPGIGGKYSHDGLNWQPLPPVFPRPLSWWSRYVPDNRNNDVWTPDLRAFNGRVWLYYSISTFGSKRSLIGLASAPSVESGQWRDEGLVIRTTESNDYNAIDPDLVIDASGNPWLTFGSWNSGIKITRLNVSSMKPTGQLYSIASRPNGIEAPTIIYRNGYYYLFLSIEDHLLGTDRPYRALIRFIENGLVFDEEGFNGYFGMNVTFAGEYAKAT